MYKSKMRAVNALAQIAEKELLKVLFYVSFTSKSSDAAEDKSVRLGSVRAHCFLPWWEIQVRSS